MKILLFPQWGLPVLISWVRDRTVCPPLLLLRGGIICLGMSPFPSLLCVACPERLQWRAPHAADSLESLSFVSPPDAAELMGSMERDSVLSNEGDVLDTDLEEEEKGIFSKPGMQMYAVNSHTSEGTLVSYSL